MLPGIPACFGADYIALGEFSTTTHQATMLFGQWLINRQLINEEDLGLALAEQKRNNGLIGQSLKKLKILNDEQLTTALSDFLCIEHISLTDVSRIDFATARMLPENICKRFDLIPVGYDGDRVLLAMADPTDIIAIDTVAVKLKGRIKPVICSSKEIQKAIETIFHGSYIEEQHLRDLVRMQIDEDSETIGIDDEDILEDFTDGELDSEAAANKPPVIRFVDLLLNQAIKSKASDIHLEPQEKIMNVRMRIDGLLREMVPPLPKMQAAVITRVKILAQMDIAERRLPQDGRFRIKAPGREIDVRASAIPSIYGEKVVMRILDKTAVNHNIDVIGFDPDLLDKFKVVLGQPHGIIVVTGPTGSGKSTTLYSALNYLKDPRKNITTVEDPVEYRLEGINQIQVKPEIGLDFASCLRSILRQDPDIILIGEIRDKETIEIAIKASLTGHLVLSTFHTNDAPSALTRMAYMGVDRYLLASTVDMVVAQRLIRRVCEHCKKPAILDELTLKRLKIEPPIVKKHEFFRPGGCAICGGTGYIGRLPIFEFLFMTPEIRSALLQGRSETEIRNMSHVEDNGGLLDSGVRRLMEGVTTAEEVVNATFAEEIL